MDKKEVLTGLNAFCSIVNYVRWSFYFPSAGTSLVVQWLRFHTPPAGSMRRPLLRELRFPKKCTVWPAAAAKSLQSCPTLCHPTDGSPPGSPVPGILQARTLEWVAISFSSAWKWEVKVKSLSRVRLLATPWTVAYQAPPSMVFARQEYWSGVPLPSLSFSLLVL